MPLDDHILEKLWVLMRGLFLVRAEGGTTNLDSDRVSHGKTGSKPPPRAGEELRDLERRWAGCQTNADRRAVLRRGFEDVNLHNNPKPSPELVRDTEEWRKAIAADPRPSRKVAKTYEISHNTVCRFRREHCQQAGELSGPRPVPPAEPGAELRESQDARVAAAGGV